MRFIQFHLFVYLVCDVIWKSNMVFNNYEYQMYFNALFSSSSSFWIEFVLGVQCQLGETEPRSIVILNYKKKFTQIQV